MNCTIQDIAHELNISRNTVSKALNGKGGVSEETKRLIFEKAREMNYRNILNETSVPAPVLIVITLIPTPRTFPDTTPARQSLSPYLGSLTSSAFTPLDEDKSIFPR